MTTGAELMDRVRRAQEELGTGDSDVALEMVEPLLAETADAIKAPTFLGLVSSDRTLIVEAFCYARVTAILALESAGAPAAVPRIRAIANEALEIAGKGNTAWKVLCAAAEMLARSGDAEGAARAIDAAVALVPQETHVVQVRGSIRSMFPAAFVSKET